MPAPTTLPFSAFAVIVYSSGVTVTLHSAVNPPSCDFAVITAVPTPVPVTFPFSSTVQMFSFEDDQITLLSVALSGVIVGIKTAVSLRIMLSSVLSNLIPVTGITTLTVHSAVNSPSCVFAVIFVVPTLTPVTLPFSSTVAISGLDDDHSTTLSVASSGVIVADNVSSVSFARRNSDLLIDTPLTGTMTVTSHSAI